MDINMNEIENEINKVFVNLFHFHPERLTEEQKSDSLLKPQIGFKAIDLFVLYMELERNLNISFDEKDIVDNRFDIYNNIVASVQKHYEVKAI